MAADKRYDQLRKQRRFVVVPVDVSIFGKMLIEGLPYGITAEGIPKDAIFVSADKDAMAQSFGFIYLHESFEPVPEGERGPLLDVTLTRHAK